MIDVNSLLSSFSYNVSPASFRSPVWNLSYHQHLVLNQHLALHQGLVFHQHLVLIDTIIAGLEYGMEWTKEWTVHAPNALVVDLPCFPESLFGRANGLKSERWPEHLLFQLWLAVLCHLWPLCLPQRLWRQRKCIGMFEYLILTISVPFIVSAPLLFVGACLRSSLLSWKAKIRATWLVRSCFAMQGRKWLFIVYKNAWLLTYLLIVS